MQVIVVGNCQVEFVAEFLNSFTDQEVEATAAEPVYLMTELAVKELHDRIRNCDVLVCQPIGDDYRQNIGLGSQYLKGLLRDDACFLMIPNLYFDAYFPTFGYLKDQYGEAIRGTDPLWGGNVPWGDYHDFLMFASAIRGWSAEQFCEKVSKPADESFTRKCIERSLEQMRLRDRSCDITGEELLRKFNFYSGDFFSFNHPSNRLMISLAKEIAFALGCETREFECCNQRLSHQHLPVYPLVDGSSKFDVGSLVPVYRRYIQAYSGNFEQLKINVVSKSFKLALDMMDT